MGTYVLTGAATLLGTGCDLPFGIGGAWVEGEWAYEARNLTGSGLSCDVTGPILTLDQEGSSFSGRAGGGTVSCRGGQGTVSVAIAGAPVVNGRVDGDQIQFDLGTSDMGHAASVNGRSMAGTVTWWLNLGEPTGLVLLQGHFAAARQATATAAR